MTNNNLKTQLSAHAPSLAEALGSESLGGAVLDALEAALWVNHWAAGDAASRTAALGAALADGLTAAQIVALETAEKEFKTNLAALVAPKKPAAK
jgi:hypothetical protein